MTSPQPKRKANPQHNIEDKAFKTLIRSYTRKRDWQMVHALLHDYGRVLFDRPEGNKPYDGEPIKVVAHARG